MAVTGDHYCKSAWNGFLLHLKHVHQYSFALFLAGLFVFMGKIMIICLNVGSFYLIMKHGYKLTDKVDSMIGPIIVVVFITSILSHIFLCHFDEATLSTLHCMAIDQELNGEPQFGPPSFHAKMRKILGDDHHQVKVAQQHMPTTQKHNPN